MGKVLDFTEPFKERKFKRLADCLRESGFDMENLEEKLKEEYEQSRRKRTLFERFINQPLKKRIIKWLFGDVSKSSLRLY